MKINDNIASEFDEFSKNYTNDMIKCVPHYSSLISSFTERLPANFSPKSILDLGCGNGNVTSQILEKFPNAQYTLIDASDEMLNICKNRFEEYNVNYVTSYFQDFDFDKNKFDFIVAGFSLHHCISMDKKDLFTKIYKSLNQDGVFSCSDLMINKANSGHTDLLEKWKQFVLNNYSTSEKWEWLMEHYNEFDNPDSLIDQKKWLENAGFNEFNTFINDMYWIHFQAVKRYKNVNN